MKILFISDIHGFSNNLKYIEELDVKEKFDKIVLLGDLYYSDLCSDGVLIFNPSKVKEFLTGYKDRLTWIRGNCDSDMDVYLSEFPALEGLVLLEVDGINIYCNHGNLYNRFFNKKVKKDEILIYGHEHFPYIEKKKDVIYINVGSISLPRNNSKPSYAVYEDKQFIIYSIDGDIIDSIYIN